MTEDDRSLLDSVVLSLAGSGTRYRVAAGRPSDGLWSPLGDLQDPRWVGERLDLIQRTIKAGRDVAATHYVGWVSSPMVAAAVFAFASSVRVPTLDGVLVESNPGGWFQGIAFERGDVFVLPTDPARRSSGARVAGESDLASHLAAEVVRVVEPIVEAVMRATRIGQRALWATVADNIATSFMSHANVFGGQRRASVVADRVFDAQKVLADSRSLWIDFDGDLTTRAGACCLAYKRPGLEYCARCPLITDAERLRRLRDEAQVPSGT